MLNKVLSNLFWKLESLWAEDTLNTLLSIYFSWMKAGMNPSSEPFTLMERQRNQRRWAAKPAHQARGWGSCTAYVSVGGAASYLSIIIPSPAPDGPIH